MVRVWVRVRVGARVRVGVGIVGPKGLEPWQVWG